MVMSSFFFYIFFCSSVLLYGVGFNRETAVCSNPKNLIFTAIKSTICVLLTYAIAYGINANILIPLKLYELFAFTTLIVYLVIGVFVELFAELSFKQSAAEFAVSYMIVVLALSECSGFADGIIICISCLVSFFSLAPVLFILTSKMQSKNTKNILVQKSLVLLCMVVIMIALYSANISWLNPGVIK